MDIQDKDVVIFPVCADESPENLECLSIEEQETVVRKARALDRAAFINSRTILRRLLARHLDCMPSRVPIEISSSGQPRVKNCNISFSISHTLGMSLVAITLNRRLGIDLERLDRKVDVKLLSEVFLLETLKADTLEASEKFLKRQFLTDWTQREALVKATGHGLVFPADEAIPEVAGLVVRSFDAASLFDYVVSVAADGADWQARLARPEETS